MRRPGRSSILWNRRRSDAYDLVARRPAEYMVDEVVLVHLPLRGHQAEGLALLDMLHAGSGSVFIVYGCPNDLRCLPLRLYIALAVCRVLVYVGDCGKEPRRQG